MEPAEGQHAPEGGGTAAADADRAKIEAKAANADKAGTRLQLQEGESFELATDRGCTDMLCLAIFAAFWVMMFAIAGASRRCQSGFYTHGLACDDVRLWLNQSPSVPLSSLQTHDSPNTQSVCTEGAGPCERTLQYRVELMESE